MSSQILQSTPATMSATWYLDGDVTDPGVVEVTVTKIDGTALYTDAATDGTGAAARTLLLSTTDTADLDRLTAVWTSATLGEITTEAEIVGDLLFTEAEARGFDKVQLANASTYPDALLAEARTRIGDALESIIGTAPFPRYKRVVLSGDGTDSLRIPAVLLRAARTIEERLSGESDWTVYTAAELADVLPEEYGYLYRETLGVFTKGRRNIRVGYEYGFERVPSNLRQAALLILMESVRQSDIDPRAMSYSDGLGTLRFVTPGLTRGAYFSNPEINAILQLPEYQLRAPALG